MTTSDRRKVRLSDGSEVHVDPKTATGLRTLMEAFDRVAIGETATFVLVEQAKDDSIHSAAFSQDQQNLTRLGDELVRVSVRLHKVGSLWEGDAPPENRSTRNN